MRYFTLLALLLGYFNSFGQLTVTTTDTDVSCFGGTDGSATAVPSGGVPPYTYTWNTVPIQTTSTVTGLAAGSYNVTVTDSNGITTQASVNIAEPPMLSASFIGVNNVSCFGNCDGTATVVGSGGTPPYVYMWNDPSSQATPIATNLCAGTYNVVIIDSNGCSTVENIVIIEPSPLSVSFITTDDTCGMCVGSANAYINGGTAPYVYSWSTGNTVQWVTGLCAGGYAVTVTDATGCVDSTSTFINLIPGATCSYGTINGLVFKDDNTNCNQDTLETGLSNVMLVATPGPYYASTNANGEYTMVLPFGNYSVSQVLSPYYNEICPVSGSYPVTIDSLNNTVANINFADTITPVQDVRILLSSGIPRPGFTFSYYLNYSSLSSVPMNGMVSLVTDNVLSYNSSSITPDIISGDTLFWNYSNLQMFENRTITATFQVPANTGLLGDTLHACAQITPLVGDVDVSNNTSCYDRVIVGSYDPNDKQVSPKGVGAGGEILPSETELTYTIRFQNSGTDTAFTVVVVDTLSSKLDVTSLKNVVASHPFTYAVSGEGVLTFTFNNILLPDSNVNEPASHGLIQFTINQHPTNSIGTEIKNTAEIYFDFNPPIVTNTVLNTVSLLTSINEIVMDNHLSIYPNPAKDNVTLDFSLVSKKEVIIEVFDVVGKKVTQLINQNLKEGNHKVMWNVSQMNSGIYFVALSIGEQRFTRKMVIQ